MSNDDLDVGNDKFMDLVKQVHRCNKNVKQLMDTVKTLIDKFDVQVQTKSHNDEDKEKERERLNKIFEKKQVGRPVGSWEDKRQQYIEMLKNKKITNPKQITLDYYKIAKKGNNYVMIARDEDA